MPQKIVESLDIKKGDIVVDFGAGTGKYSIPLSKKVAETGKVYAIEIGYETIDRLQNELVEAETKYNTEILHTNIETNIPEITQNSCDWVVCANILFTLDNKDGAINTIKNIIKKDGKVLVVDWTGSFQGMGPQPEDLFTENEALEKFKKNGFNLIEKVSSGSHHYGLIFSQLNKDELRKNDENDENEVIIEDIEE